MAYQANYSFALFVFAFMTLWLACLNELKMLYQDLNLAFLGNFFLPNSNRYIQQTAHQTSHGKGKAILTWVLSPSVVGGKEQ